MSEKVKLFSHGLIGWVNKNISILYILPSQMHLKIALILKLFMAQIKF